MSSARAAEYMEVEGAARTATNSDAIERVRVARRLRDGLRRIHRRDFFPPPERDTARAAVDALSGDAPAESSAPTVAGS
jgi:hypothetical protein